MPFFSSFFSLSWSEFPFLFPHYYVAYLLPALSIASLLPITQPFLILLLFFSFSVLCSSPFLSSFRLPIPNLSSSCVSFVLRFVLSFLLSFLILIYPFLYLSSFSFELKSLSFHDPPFRFLYSRSLIIFSQYLSTISYFPQFKHNYYHKFSFHF